MAAGSKAPPPKSAALGRRPKGGPIANFPRHMHVYLHLPLRRLDSLLLRLHVCRHLASREPHVDRALDPGDFSAFTAGSKGGCRATKSGAAGASHAVDEVLGCLR